MKKLRMKILAPALSTMAAVAVVAPAVVAVTTNANKVDNNVKQPVTVNANLFNIKDGTLGGFKDNVTQEQINGYVRQNGNKLVLPACKTIGANAFKNITVPFGTTIVIDKATTKLEPFAFYAVKDVKQITFTDGVDVSELSDIGANAFAFCDALATFAVPKKLKSVGEAAFYGCKALRQFDFRHFTIDDEITGQPVADLDGINNAMDEIGPYAFAATYNPAQPTNQFQIIVSNDLPTGLKAADFAMKTKLSGLAGRIANSIEPIWYQKSVSWIVGVNGSETFDIDISIPHDYLKIQEQGEGRGVIAGIKDEKKVLLANSPFNALLVPETVVTETGTITIDGIDSQLWKDAGDYIRDLDMSLNKSITEIQDGFIPLKDDTEQMESYATVLKNVYLKKSNITRIGDRAFAGIHSLEWINLNDCSLTSIGNYAFANSAIRCFDSNPITINPQRTEDNISMLIIDTDRIQSIGEGAFNASSVEGIKFVGQCAVNTTYGVGAFAQTKIWQLDFSNFTFVVNCTQGNFIIAQGGNTNDSESTASALFKSLFMPTGTTPSNLFTGAFSQIVQDESGQALNKVIAPHVTYKGEFTEDIQNLDESLWCKSFASVIEALGPEYATYTVTDQWKSSVPTYGQHSLFEALYDMSQSEELKSDGWNVTNPASTYQFIDAHIDEHIDTSLIGGKLPVGGEDFTFGYSIAAPDSFILDADNSKFFSGTDPIDASSLTIDRKNQLITIPGESVSGDIKVALVTEEIVTHQLNPHLADGEQHIKFDGQFPIKFIGDAEVQFSVAIDDGFVFDLENTYVHTQGSETPIAGAWDYDRPSKTMTVHGSALSDTDLDLVFEMQSKAAELTLDVSKVDKEGYVVPTDPIVIDVQSDWTFDFQLKTGKEYKSAELWDGDGHPVKFEVKTTPEFTTITVKSEDLIKASASGVGLSIVLDAKNITAEEYMFVDMTKDTRITDVTCTGEPTRGKDLEMTITASAAGLTFDPENSIISINGVNVATDAGITVTGAGTTSIKVTMPAKLILGDVFVKLTLKTNPQP